MVLPSCIFQHNMGGWEVLSCQTFSLMCLISKDFSYVSNQVSKSLFLAPDALEISSTFSESHSKSYCFCFTQWPHSFCFTIEVHAEQEGCVEACIQSKKSATKNRTEIICTTCGKMTSYTILGAK